MIVLIYLTGNFSAKRFDDISSIEEAATTEIELYRGEELIFAIDRRSIVRMEVV